MKKIVAIEDDSDLLELLKYTLEKEGYLFVASQTGKSALELCERERPDLVILDIMLPDSDGLEICKAIRNHPDLANTPVIFLTARATETDRVDGLELGANDYIVKPFFVRELIARIKIQFRRQAQSVRTLNAGDLALDLNANRVFFRSLELTLTATEFRLLAFLMTHPGIVFSRERLLNTVWGCDRDVTDRTVDVYVRRLRQKVEMDPTNPPFIRCVRGFGYSFSGELVVEPTGESASVAQHPPAQSYTLTELRPVRERSRAPNVN